MGFKIDKLGKKTFETSPHHYSAWFAARVGKWMCGPGVSPGGTAGRETGAGGEGNATRCYQYRGQGYSGSLRAFVKPGGKRRGKDVSRRILHGC